MEMEKSMGDENIEVARHSVTLNNSFDNKINKLLGKKGGPYEYYDNLVKEQEQKNQNWTKV